MSAHASPIALTAEVIAALSAPFPLDLVEVKPGATTKDKQRALALAYVDWRAYARRLDAVVGPANWSFKLIPWGPTRLIAELTILGITKSATGEGDAADANCGTIAEAQAKKRACAEFGVGRFLYDLPNTVWADYDADRKQFRDARAVATVLYQHAGLIAARAATPVPAGPQRSQGRPPNPAQLAQARQVLQQAETQAARQAPSTRQLSRTEPHTASSRAAQPATRAQVRQLMAHQEQAVALAEATYGVTRFYDLTTQQAQSLLEQLAV